MPSNLKGTRPSDLPEVHKTWTEWSLAERVKAAKEVAGYSDPERQAAVAITLLELPGSIPLNNCCSALCLGRGKPWGWTPDTWTAGMPSGFAVVQEGAVGKRGVYLAFRRVSDSLGCLLRLVRRRGMTTPDAYARRWVAVDYLYSESVSGFSAVMHRVKAVWGARSEPQPVVAEEAPPTLRRGDHGPVVARLQGLLIRLGFEGEADGDFGPGTEAAVKDFQASNRDQTGARLKIDGVVGPKTWWVLTQAGRTVAAP